MIRYVTKIPTENLVAYDHFLKGMDYANQQTAEGLVEAVKYFQLAIEEDPNFANAHAYMAICYYYMDVFLIDKTHLPEILSYADKAILLDPELPESLIAKGMYFMTVKRYESAVEYLEKALGVLTRFCLGLFITLMVALKYCIFLHF